MSYSLNSLKGVQKGIILGTTIGVTKGDTRSLDNGSYDLRAFCTLFAAAWLSNVSYSLNSLQGLT